MHPYRPGDDKLYGGPGSDELLGGEGTNHLWGGPGPDILESSRGNDYMVGGTGSDEFHPSGAGTTATIVVYIDAVDGEQDNIVCLPEGSEQDAVEHVEADAIDTFIESFDGSDTRPNCDEVNIH